MADKSEPETSAPRSVENPFNSEEIMVPEQLEKGTLMTKISEKKEKKVLFRIDPDEGRIIYKSSKGGIVPIETIKELRTGEEARYSRIQFKKPEELENLWITVIYILDGNYKTLHMIADTRDVFQMWNTSLRKLINIRQGLMAGLGNVEMRQNVWERQYWKGADEEGDQKLDFDDVERLCLRLNVNVTKEDLEKLFKEADTNCKGYLDFVDFQRFVKKLKYRPELEAIYGNLSSSNGGKLDVSGFTKFVRETQKSKLSDAEIKKIFDSYAGASSSPNELAETMSLEGFTKFLMSPENAAFSERGKPIWQDMTLPISDYYISSSHNTYLVGHQLVGVSTIEGYIRALLHSCRSVELDIYDGDTEPVIYHGKTFTSKVSLRDICQAIAKYAFVASPYPIIISAEVHCGIAQQDKLVDVMTEVFGESLIQAPVEGRPKLSSLPSPESLKGKFLLKAKNLYIVEQLAAIQAARAAAKAEHQKQIEIEAETPSSTSEDGETETKIKEGMNKMWKKMRGKEKKEGDGKEEGKHKTKMSFKLTSLLVYTIGVKCHGLDPDIDYAPEHIFSLSENAANRICKASMMDLVRHAQTHLVRIYPKGTRVNSTNFEPNRYWAAGCQVVAINWQTFDLGYMITQAMFQRNGRAGYVLKPEALRRPELLAKRTQHFLDINIISAQQLPRLRDSRGQEIIEKSVVDPYVHVSLHIPDWTNSPFLPDSATAAGVKYTPSSNATTTSVSSARTVSFKTKVIKNNGFNPLWQEQLHIPFDCVGDMKDLIFVEIAVRQEGDDEEDQPIGVYCVPLGCLEQGYRHLPLHDAQLSQHLFSTLFVQTSIRDIN